MTDPAREGVDGPDGRTWAVRPYPTGSTARFPSFANTPMNGGVLYWPMRLAGWVAHLTVFRRSWTVAVTPWHNLPGPRWRGRFPDRTAAEEAASQLRQAIRAGRWEPGRPDLPIA